MDEQATNTALSPLEHLAAETDQLAERLRSTDMHGSATRWLRQKDREFNYQVFPRGDEDITMRWLRDYKHRLEGWLAIIQQDRAAHGQEIAQNKAIADARYADLVAQAHARIDRAVVEGEQAASASLKVAQQARDAAQRALSDHEAHVPAAAERPDWLRRRRDLILAIEDAAGGVADAATCHAAARRVFCDARRLAWAKLTDECGAACTARVEVARVAADAAQAALQVEQEAFQDVLRDLRAARLLDT
jgi:hypothetical protein